MIPFQIWDQDETSLGVLVQMDDSISLLHSVKDIVDPSHQLSSSWKHLPFNPGRRETLDIRYHHLLVFLWSFDDDLPLLSSVLLDVRLGSRADDFNNQVREADAIELFWKVSVGRVVLSRQPLDFWNSVYIHTG